MSLTALNWRKLPVRTIAVSGDVSVSNLLNNVYDMLTGSLYFDGSARVTGSNSAWQNVGRFITGSGTGSNTEAVYAYPPTQTSVSQSVIIVGKNTTGAVTSTAPTMCTNEDAYVAGKLAIACIKNPVSFVSWASASAQFGAGSASTGYGTITPVLVNTSANKIVIYESQEALAIFIGKVSTDFTWGGIAGAIVDPEQTSTSVDAEADNRLYGMTVAPHTSYTAAGISSAFWTTADNFLDHSGTTGLSRFIVFNPQLTTTFTAESMKLNGSTSSTTSYTSISGKFVKSPILVQNASGNFLGRLREISVIRSMQHNLIVRDSSNNIVGFTAGASETTIGSAALFNY